jgi:fructose-specific phosphotransferase system IIC component
VKEFLIKLRQHLLSGVSFAIPFIACGGILIAGSIASVPLDHVAPVLTVVADKGQAAIVPGNVMVVDNAVVTTAGEVALTYADHVDFIKGCSAIIKEGKHATALLLPDGKVVVGKDGKAIEADVPSSGGPNFSGRPIQGEILGIGVAAFTLMPAVLAGYISFSIAGKPGLVGGFVGGWLATHIPNGQDIHGVDQFLTAGFLGAIVAGIIAGYIVHWVKKLKVPKFIRPIMPILIVPIVSALIIGFLMLEVIGIPIAHVMEALGEWLKNIPPANKVILGVILGCMIAFDMGGPINKVAFFFGSGLIAQGRPEVMGAVATAICIPPIGMGLATMIGRKIWTESEREAGLASFAMGFVGITEGAIPFAAADPVRVIPSIMIGSAVGSVIAMLGGVADHAPHGGPIVIFVTDNKLMYVVAITTGVVVTAFTVNAIKLFTHGSDVDPAEGAAA